VCSGVRGRQSGSGSALGNLSEERPKPLPRQKRLQDDDDDVKPASRTSPNVLDRKTPPARTTPTSDQRLTPVDRRKSPADDRDQFVSRHRLDDSDQAYRRSPLGRNSSTDRRSPRSDVLQTLPKDKYKLEEGREPLDRYGASRKSPSDRLDSPVRNTPLSDRQQPRALSRKSSVEGDTFNRSYDRQKSPVDDRKTPSSTDRRKTPVDFQRKKDGSSPSTRRKSSQLDLLMESTGVKEGENSDEEKRYRDQRKSDSPQSRGRKSVSPSVKRSESTEKNPFDNIHQFPEAVSKASKHSRSSDSSGAKPARRRSQVSVFFDRVKC